MTNYSATSEFRELLIRSHQVLIALDGSIDLDAWASGIGISYLLDKLGIDHRLICSNPIPEPYQVTPASSRLIISSSVLEIRAELPNIDLIVIPDLGDLGQLGELYTKNVDFFSSIPIVHIDHHEYNQIDSTLSILDHVASSTSEQIFLIFEDFGIDVPTYVATILYAGIVSDTRSFATPTVTPRTLNIAAKLVKQGADVVEASRQALSQTASQLRLWGLALVDLETAIDGRVYMVVVTGDMIVRSKSNWGETTGLVNLVDNIAGSEVAVLFKKLETGNIRVSFRSPKKYPVVEIARKFGGGGHEFAAACTIKNVSLEEAKQIVLNELENLLQ